MKVNGKMINLMEGEDSYIQMEMFMKESGLIIKQKVTEHIFILTEPVTKVNGLEISNKGMELKFGLMELDMKVLMLMEKKRVMENSSGKTVPSMKGNFTIIIFTEMVLINGLTAELTQETGIITKCMEKVPSNGKMVEYI